RWRAERGRPGEARSRCPRAPWCRWMRSRRRARARPLPARRCVSCREPPGGSRPWKLRTDARRTSPGAGVPSAAQQRIPTAGAVARSPAEETAPLSTTVNDAATLVETDIPARLDRLPWSAWHWRVVVALGVTWVLDGLEVTLVGAVAGALVRPDTLALTEQQVGGAATAYLAGAILGPSVFGRLTDLVGRKRLFLVTLSVYLVATLLTALSTGFLSFAVFRALTGAGIGGEYAA